MAGTVGANSGSSSFIIVNKSLSLTGVRPSDGSLVSAEPLSLVTDLRYELEEASGDRDLRQPEPILHFFSADQLNVNQSLVQNKFLSMFNESFKMKLIPENMDAVHMTGTSGLITLISAMSTETIKETHRALWTMEPGGQGRLGYFEELVLQTGTSASTMFILVIR